MNISSRPIKRSSFNTVAIQLQSLFKYWKRERDNPIVDTYTRLVIRLMVQQEGHKCVKVCTAIIVVARKLLMRSPIGTLFHQLHSYMYTTDPLTFSPMLYSEEKPIVPEKMTTRAQIRSRMAYQKECWKTGRKMFTRRWTSLANGANSVSIKKFILLILLSFCTGSCVFQSFIELIPRKILLSAYWNSSNTRLEFFCVEAALTPLCSRFS